MLVALLALVASPLPAATLQKTCPTRAADRVTARQPARIRPLADMPPARLIKGVFREVDGCPQPIVVREQVGEPGR
ncbi:hypothetical protein [Sphingomonas sp.]|jgi:hypothetical protein|uniref:hypothetical protein n=1 Tax=Sphingomonas sp. TaxID=28214 RepID=UPI002D80FAA0|nr:hypothetical protein [Sphingomonas sp.]HEU0044885.1 hypothetical protein [Sphingomonas sp.]